MHNDGEIGLDARRFRDLVQVEVGIIFVDGFTLLTDELHSRFLVHTMVSQEAVE